MARNISPDSVSSKVSDLKVGESLLLENPYTSVMVMVSNLKRKEEHKAKVFKIKSDDKQTNVTRLK
tara:strand:+ start:941 stop:1138 length:198 start_codon:yes stop_codon:yes gene_type:complete